MVENSTEFDVMIIGGGPGGLSAAMWCAALGLRTILIEKEAEFGGQLLWTFNPIENYLGIGTITGRDLRDRFVRHLGNRAITWLSDVSIEQVDIKKRKVLFADGTTARGRAIIIATGVRRRRLEVSGEAEFAGRGILDSGAKSRNAVRGKSVVIVGGGDAALENALILSDTANEVIVVHRRDQFSARTEFLERAKQKPVITFVLDTVVTAVIGKTAVEGVELQNVQSGERTIVAAEAVLIRIGVVPNTELFREQLFMDGTGYLRTDASCATNVSGVYAVGDVANPIAPTINNAVGQGSVAAKSIVLLLRSNAAKR